MPLVVDFMLNNDGQSLCFFPSFVKYQLSRAAWRNHIGSGDVAILNEWAMDWAFLSYHIFLGNKGYKPEMSSEQLSTEAVLRWCKNSIIFSHPGYFPDQRRSRLFAALGFFNYINRDNFFNFSFYPPWYTKEPKNCGRRFHVYESLSF